MYIHIYTDTYYINLVLLKRYNRNMGGEQKDKLGERKVKSNDCRPFNFSTDALYHRKIKEAMLQNAAFSFTVSLFCFALLFLFVCLAFLKQSLTL